MERPLEETLPMVLPECNLSIAVVTCRASLWEGLTPFSKRETLPQTDIVLSWHCVSPQELFHRLEELEPVLLVFDDEQETLPVTQTIQLLKEEGFLEEKEVIVLCETRMFSTLLPFESVVCLELSTPPTMIRRLLLQMVEPFCREALFAELRHQNKVLQERLSQQRKDYAAFAGKLSHEIRTPLCVIEGFTINLIDGRHGTLTEEQQGGLAVIHKNIARLKDYLGDVLNHSSLSLREDELVTKQAVPLPHRSYRRRYLSMKELVKEVLVFFQDLFSRKELTVSCSFERLPRLWMERSKIRQVLINLLSNAYKYTERGGQIAIRASVLVEQGENASGMARREAFLRLVIEDTGIGIAEEELSSLFTEFTRVGELAGRVEGTGLGLAVCKEIIEEHRGEIELESTLGEGTRVTIKLPLDLRRRQAGKVFWLREQSLCDELFSLFPAYLENVEQIQTKDQMVAMLEGGAPHLLLYEQHLYQRALEQVNEKRKAEDDVTVETTNHFDS